MNDSSNASAHNVGFTTGPWKTFRLHPDPDTRAQLIEVYRENGEGALGQWSTLAIATIYVAPDGSVGEANARLIAAAPELLEALVPCYGILNAMCADSNNGLHHAALELARAAIAKSTGQPTA